MQSAAISTSQSASSGRSRAIFAASLGQFFELYDFSIYGFFAVEIGRSFFPSSDPLTSLLGAFATYGVGFLMRPVGAIVVGAYGDSKGRRAALVLTVALMAISTGLVALVPPYAQIGIWAPIILVVLRLCQGFSTGGEWGGAAAFLVEYAAPAVAVMPVASTRSRRKSATWPDSSSSRCCPIRSRRKLSKAGDGE